MIKILVVRPNDDVVVSIFRDEIDNTYRFINITKSHICTCKFNSVEEAIADLDKHVEEGKVLKYKIFGSFGRKN